MSLLNLTGFTYTHDPTIVKENGIYYRFQTGPGLPILTSKDLIHWDLAGRIFNKNPDWTSKKIPGSKDFWAPEVVYRKGQWRVYYSVSTFGKNISSIGLVTCDSITRAINEDPGGTEIVWQDRGPVIFSKEEDDYNAIDPAVFTDFDNKDWLLFGSFWSGLLMLELNEEGFIIEGSKPKNIASRIPYSSAKGKKNFGNPSIQPNPIEGGFIFPYQGYYYLFASHDFCCRGSASSYHIVCGRSKNPQGKYLDFDGIDMLQGGGSLLRDGFSFESWAGPGHNSIFTDDDGKTYLVYHAYDRLDNGKAKLMIEEILWKDGWPYLE
ncbi:MAG: arabinan endo-1,5-alpha-L-arabinosidase [Treponema sp.]|nr:arabinan endo-1,5-alpha-L-arabinosidase [Treponema sp.]